MAEAAATLWQRLWYTRMRDALRGRFDGSLDWRRTLTRAELPDEIKRVVEDTVRATRLWSSEKVDVTKELVAHFQDGLAGGRPAPALAATFGDVRQTAALIRRAKKRGRPAVWQVWHFGWIGLAAMLLAYVSIGLWMMMDRPSIKVDYLARFRDRVLATPADDRAWPIYRDTLLAMGVRGDPQRPQESASVPDFTSRPGDLDWPEVEQFLGEHADAVARLRTAAGRPNLGFVPSNSWVDFSPEDRQLFGVTVTDADVVAFQSQTAEDRWVISTLIPDLYQLRTTARVLECDARRALLESDAVTALADIRAQLGVSRHCRETPFLVSLLVASAVESLACDTIQDAFRENPRLWSESQLRDLAHAISADPIDWKQGFNAETVMFHDTMQRFYTDDGRGDGRLAYRSSQHQNVFELLSSVSSGGGEEVSPFVSSDGLAMLIVPAANWVVASRKETTEVYQGFINTAISKIGLPLDEQQDVPLPNEELLSDRAGPIGRFRYLFVRLMVPAYQVLWNKIASAEGQRDGVLLGIGLELYHREHGAWPKSLAELSPRWLPTVPIDRITGNSLGFKIVDHRPVVYSVGVDRDDDGGHPPSDDGQPDPELASPNHYQVQPVLESKHDGDWIIWSTAPIEAATSNKPAAESDELGCMRAWKPNRGALPEASLWLAASDAIGACRGPARSILQDCPSGPGRVAQQLLLG